MLAAPSSASRNPDVETAREGLAQAVEAGGLPAKEARLYRRTLLRYLKVIGRLPGQRARELAAVLDLVADQSRRYTRPRALALFGMLDFNVRYLGSHPVPRPGADVRDGDGIRYRAFAGRGLQLHPLADFAALNSTLTAGHDEEAHLLARALVARGVRSLSGLVWEYYFPFGSGAAPWTSGMSQAVAAQALARAGEQLGDSELTAAARQAFRALSSGLLLDLPDGPWVRLYDFSRLTVLNAQLQGLLSLHDYAELTQDEDAAELVERLSATSLVLVPNFDTGYWSRYALGGSESVLGYHRYVVSLLRRLANRTEDTFWAETAARFASYEGEPPAFELGKPPEPLITGRNAEAALRFWLSKRSRVVVDVGGRSAAAVWLSGRWQALHISLAGRPPGLYPVTVTAVDLAGNRTQVKLLPIAILEPRSGGVTG